MGYDWMLENEGSHLVWLDLEMTGLEVKRHVIVELATVITDAELKILATGPSFVIHASEEELSQMESVVSQMHTSSGLLVAIRASMTTRDFAERETIRFLKEHIPDDYRPPLCGNSIWTDRIFLSSQMPELHEFFHYRSIDVTTIKELCRRWYPDVLQQQPPKSENHRALEDIMESITELRYYRAKIFR